MLNVIPIVRDLIEDNLSDGYNYFEYINSRYFTLSEPNAQSSTIKVYKNGTLMAGANYSFDSDTNKLNYTGTIAVGDKLEVYYKCYAKYSDFSIKAFIRNALYWITVCNYRDYAIESAETITYTEDGEAVTLTDRDYRLIGLVTSILIKGDIKSYKTIELSITFNETLSVEDKIRRAVETFKTRYGVLDYHPTDEEEIE
jgi:hypothetical protein